MCKNSKTYLQKCCFRFLKTPQSRQMQMIIVKPPAEHLEDLYFCQCDKEPVFTTEN